LNVGRNIEGGGYAAHDKDIRPTDNYCPRRGTHLNPFGRRLRQAPDLGNLVFFHS
jgi:hypothetical protein